MRFLKNITMLLVSTMLLVNCTGSKYTFDNLPPKQLIFGDGGGFAGSSTTYTLIENGQLFKAESNSMDRPEMERIKKKKAGEIFEQLETLRIDKLDIEKPGNLYYFIRMTNEEIDHKITWGAGDYNIRKDIIDFYKSLKALTKDRKVIKVHKPKVEEEEEEG